MMNSNVFTRAFVTLIAVLFSMIMTSISCEEVQAQPAFAETPVRSYHIIEETPHINRFAVTFESDILIGDLDDLDEDKYYDGIHLVHSFKGQFEYFFVDWFSLGIDLAVGYDGNYNKTVMESLLTAKFTLPLKVVNLWAELGFGGFYWIRHDICREYSAILISRLRFGSTFNLNDNWGLGINLSFAHSTGSATQAEFGLHLQYRF